MDKLNRYQEIIHRLLVAYQEWYNDPTDTGVDIDVIADDVHGEYLLMSVGWRGETRVRRPVFYLRLKNERVWIEEDWTKEGISAELVAAGIPHKDIVLALNPPEVRHLTEFAAA